MEQHQQLLDVLTHEGVLINVGIRYWRATKKLNAEDLGLSPDSVEERLISLGHKNLLPRESLQAFALIESRARAVIEGGTFPFLDGLGHFLPNAKLQEVTGVLTGLEQEFQTARADFLSRYSEMRASAMREWRQAAGRLPGDPAQLVATIEASFPGVEKMARSFGFTTQLFQIRIPEDVGLALVTAEEQLAVVHAREEAARQAADRIHQGVQNFVADCVATLREQTATICEEMLQSMQSGSTGVHQKTLNRLIRFIDEFKTLNFAGDREMEAQLDRVRTEYLSRTAEEYRDDSFARQRLQQGLQALATTARDMARQDSHEIVERFGQMGVRKFHLAA